MTGDRLSRAVLTGRNLELLAPKVEAHGFAIVDTDPDLIICHGGDGTLVGSEREWPGVPKVALQRSEICRKCPRHGDDEILGAVARGECSRHEFLKVEAETKGRRLVGINEVLVHNAVVTSAVRYIVWINGGPLTHEIVGDGLVVATPFGSSGYFRSITNSTFQVGLGLAFNNSTEPLDHLVLNPDAEVRVRITRGPALLASDNNPEHVQLDRDDEVVIRRHSQPAKILMVETLTCPHCARIREADGATEHIHMRPDHRGALPNR
jgi:NAD+ kinase